MPDRPARRQRSSRRDDSIGVVVPVKVRDLAGLPEMLHAKRPHPMAVDGAKPSARRRVAIEHRDDPAMRRHDGEQLLDMRTRVNEAALARAVPLSSRC